MSAAAARFLPPGFSRLVSLSGRERVLLGLGAAASLLLLVTLAMPSDEEPTVELAAVPPPVAATPLASAPPPPVAMAPPPKPAADPAALSGIILRGVSGGGPAGGAAIFGSGDGAQRVVRIGRDIVPGIMLRQVGVSHAVASSGSGDLRLELNKVGAVALAASSSSASAPASALTSSSAAVAGRSDQHATMQYRLGLQPVKSAGRTSGYAIKPGAQLPDLQSAGLRPGDMIVGVNGSSFDEERLMELAWQIGNSDRTEFEFIRNGKRMTAALDPQSRR